MQAHLLRPSEVAQTLGVSRSFSYQLIRSGELPSIRIGRSVRVRPEDLETFIEVNATKKVEADSTSMVARKIIRGEL